MYLSYAELKNKIMGCWAGKNIGGVLGGPDEGHRRINDISFYIDKSIYLILIMLIFCFLY